MPHPKPRRRRPRPDPPGQSGLTALLITPESSEADLQRETIALAVAQGWLVMHVLRSKVGRGGHDFWVTNTAIVDPDGAMNKGWPDLTLIHPSGRLLFLELKGPRGVPSPEQLKIMRLLQTVQRFSFGRVKAYVVKPREWASIVRLLEGPNRKAARRPQ